MDYRFSLIGYPIEHSLSPWIHQKFLRKAGLKGEYNLHEIDPAASFEDEIEKLKLSQVNGFNVTVPYKQDIIPLLDNVDTAAQKMGAVNTAVNNNGIWTGYNTDGVGYLRSLESKYPELLSDKSSRILIIGAGGAARGIYVVLSQDGFSRIDIANRTEKSAAHILKKRNERTTSRFLTLAEAEQFAGYYDLIIQTTSVGMKPVEEKSIFSLGNIKSDAIVSDIIYQPINTAFLMQAEKKGASLHYGHTMLLYQAQYAFELWTGKRITIDEMDEELMIELKGR